MALNHVGVLPIGFRLAERYRIVKHLAAGGFGITYLAEHEALKKQYAIKEHFPREFAFRDGSSVRPNTADRNIFDWALKRFAEEAEKLARFKHPAIVIVADVFEDNGTAYMVMEFEPGQTMSNWLDGLGRPPSHAELDRIAGLLLDALEVMHGANFLHRDIAPDNIIIRPDGSPCLIDFGAARQAMGQQTKTLTAIVKAGYSPVEQYDTDGGEEQGPWTDIYALAATLYRAVTGNRPPEAPGRTLRDRFVAVASAAKATYRPELLRAIDLSLSVRPQDRPQNVAALRKLLEAQEEGGEREPPPIPKTDPRVAELANWQRIRGRMHADEVREHLTRYPNGTTAGEARALLETILWQRLGPSPDQAGLSAFLAEFPNGLHAHVARDAIKRAQERELSGTYSPPVSGERSSASASYLRVGLLVAIGVGVMTAVGIWLWPTGNTAISSAPIPQPTPTPSPVPLQRPSTMRPLSTAEERALKPKDEFQECESCPRMVVIPPGRFRMGSEESEQGRFATEGPVREVTIAKPFAVGKFTVTFAEWEACVRDGGCQSNPSDEGWGRGTRPVINVSWNGTKQYVAWISRKTGKSYRLLSEAEWEYAARAHSTTRYWWGQEIEFNRANCNGCGSQWDKKSTAPVGSFPANAFGLYDMHGNVWQWVEDCWESYATAPTDGTGKIVTDCSLRIYRGGSWFNPSYLLRSANRYGGSPSTLFNTIGFRVARTLQR